MHLSAYYIIERTLFEVVIRLNSSYFLLKWHFDSSSSYLSGRKEVFKNRQRMSLSETSIASQNK